ncbi:hypothetical protein [Bordetella genomosp. 13]|uniref:hypothetical protein n=1 Tax=Bordetella genomosp. 13 TaxID=463040 RepID=UPI0011A811C3|nr:hypothetical protein [Bordetella genomosp. 13]
MARYLACHDIVEQLVASCRHKQAQPPTLDANSLLSAVESHLKSADWGFSYDETAWVMRQVAQELGIPDWPSTCHDSMTQRDIEALLKLDQEPLPRVKSRVQAALDGLAARAQNSRAAETK